VIVLSLGGVVVVIVGGFTCSCCWVGAGIEDDAIIGSAVGAVSGIGAT
jgi:hypothetical protein